MPRGNIASVVATLAVPFMLLGGCAEIADRPVRAGTRPLVVHGATSVVELGPVPLAVEMLYPAGTKVAPGGAATLGRAVAPPDVANQSETQLLCDSVREPS